MIIRNNLASAPTRNYSLFLIGSAVVVLIAATFTIYNLWTFLGILQQSSELRDSIRQQQTRLGELEGKSANLNQKISQIKTAQFVEEAEFMNNAIKRRTLSWTSLFNRFEEVMPEQVKMISIRPVIQGKTIGIDLEMAAQNLQDMVETVQTLENDEAFSRVLLKGENDSQTDGLLHFSISLQYLPPDETSTDQEGE